MNKSIFLACTLGLVHVAYGAQWNLDADGAWNVNGNWTSPAVFPNAVGATAVFPNVITATRTITSGIGITVGNLTFDNDNGNTYLVTLSGNTLTLNNGGTANLTVTSTNTGAHTLSCPITLSNPLLVTQDSSATFTISGAIAGANSLTKAGTGVLTLTGANTYSNGTTVSDGTLRLSGTGALLSTGALTLSGSTSFFNISAISTGTTTIGNLNGVAGSFIQLGNNTLQISGAGAMVFGGNIVNAGNINFSSAGTLELTGFNSFSLLSATNPAGTLKLSGSGSLEFVGTVSISGVFDISNITDGGTTVRDFPSQPGSTVVLGTKTLTFGTTVGGLTNRSAFSGSGGITKIGTGTVTLEGVSTYTGTTTISVGRLSISASDNIGDPTAPLTFANGTLRTTASFTMPAARLITIGTTGTFETDPAVITTVDSKITGSGSLTKTGTGTLLLTDSTNDYGGSTTINNGTLSLSGSGILPPATTVSVNSSTSFFDISAVTTGATIGDLTGVASSTVTLGSKALTFGTNSASVTFAGVINGVGGSIIKNGNGTVSLTGSNTYSGGTTLNSGTISVGTNNALGSGTLTFATTSNNTLRAGTAGLTINNPITLTTSGIIDTNSTTFSLSGNIGGGSGLTVQGGSIAVFSGTNTYGGVTTITTTTLRLDAPGSLPALGNVTNNGSLVFNYGGSGSYSGSVSGSGLVTVQGGGTVTLAGTNSYAGGTNIDVGQLTVTGSIVGDVTVNTAGTFDVQNSFTMNDLVGAAGSNAIIVGGNTLTFGSSNSTEFAGVISNSGTLTKQGSGTFTVSGINTFTGTLNVGAGILNMASTGVFPLTSTTNINPGATLVGVGTLGGVNLQGMLSPGNSIGTINVGDITFDTGSIFIVEITDTDSDKVISSGTVTVNPGAIITLTGSGLTYPQSSYFIIDSAAPLVRNGDFILINPFTRFSISVSYQPQDVLVLAVEFVTDFTASGNASGPARCFSELLRNLPPDLIPITDILNIQTVNEWQGSFIQMQPSDFDNIAYSQENAAEQIRRSFSNHLFEEQIERCQTKLPWRIWFAPFAQNVRQHKNGSHNGYKENFRGFTTALDYQSTNHWTLSSGFSYVDGNVGVSDVRTTGNFKTYAGSFAAIWENNHFFADGLVSYLYSTASGKRKMHFRADHQPAFFDVPPVSRIARHHQYSNQLMGHLGGGYCFKFNAGEHGTLNLYPFIDVDYVYIMQQGYKEYGAQSLNLHVKSKDYDLLRPECGLGFGYAGCFENILVHADISASYIREQRFIVQTTKSSFQNSSCTFSSKGSNPRNNLLAPSARLTLSNTKSTPISFSISYHGEFGPRFKENGGEAELKVAF